MSNEHILAEANRLAKEERFQDAIEVLNLLPVQDTASLRLRTHYQRILGHLDFVAQDGASLLKLSDEFGDRHLHGITLMELRRFPEALAVLSALLDDLLSANDTYFLDVTALMVSYCSIIAGDHKRAAKALEYVSHDEDASIFWIDNVPTLYRSFLESMITECALRSESA